MKRFPAFLLFASAWIFMAMAPSRCTPGLLVPPTHIANGESPRTLPPRKASLGGGGGIFDGAGRNGCVDFSGFMLNPEGTLGLGHNLDLRLLSTNVHLSAVGHIDGLLGCELTHDSDYLAKSGLGSTIHSATLRLKWNPAANPIWAMTAGGGFGYSQNQWFYSLEHVQILAYENRYFVPYFNLKWTVNVPGNPRPIYWRDRDYHKTPLTTWGTEILSGYKIPLSHIRSDAPFLKFEVGTGGLRDRDTTFSAFLFDVMLEVPFGF